ncbi:hypothetical protein CYY_000961 [Polysphondylium violaceum]|uniref:Glycosyltransferase n=1 Tax=Polysphondylium violaceum TaxID=133409 RepID=A0A8J4VB09_9MYCE|nr:hypothetical protein CYY_000961 [Polysphondylium violaceum]
MNSSNNYNYSYSLSEDEDENIMSYQYHNANNNSSQYSYSSSKNNIIDDEGFIQEDNHIKYSKKNKRSIWNRISYPSNCSKRKGYSIVISLFLCLSFILILFSFILWSIGNNDKAVIDSYCRKASYRSNSDNDDAIDNSGGDYCVFDSKSFEPDYSCTPSFINRSMQYQYNSRYGSSDQFTPPIVSVVIPFYNTPVDQFNECMISVLDRQSLQNIQVIVVDDGSSLQNSIQSLHQWKEKDKRIRIITHKANRGLPASRNTGIANSIGKYIFILDSDDLIEPTCLEKLVWKLESSPHIHFTKGYTVGFQAINYTWQVGFEQRSKFLNENYVTVAIMFRAELFQIEGGKSKSIAFGYDESIVDGMEDWDFYLKCAEHGYWGETVPEYFDWYRRKPSSAQSEQWKNNQGVKKQLFINQLKTKYTKLYKDHYFPNHSATPNPFSLQVNHSIFSNHLIKHKPRVLLILPWLNTGGSDKFNLNLCKQLVEKGWEITIITTLKSTNNWLNRFQYYTTDIFLTSNFLTLDNLPRFFCYIIESRKIDITFLSNTDLGYSFLPYLHQYCPSTAIVDYNHMEEENWRNGGYPRYSLSMQPYLDLSIVSSNHLKQWMQSRQQQQQQQIDNDKIQVSFINVDPKEFEMNKSFRYEIRNLYHIKPKQHVVILYVARLVPIKQPIEALSIFRNINDQLADSSGPKFSVLFVGDGPLRNQVDQYVQSYGLNGVVKILGDVPTQDMKKIISASDIVFVPSLMEGISMIFYEAMAAGVVPVGSDIGGQDELVDKNCGYLIDPSQYQSTLIRLINDPQHLSVLGKNCVERIQSNFGLDKMGDNIISLFCKSYYNNFSKQQRQQQYQQQKTGSIDSNIGVEMAIQAIELHKLQSKNEIVEQELESLQKSMENDRAIHEEFEREKLKLVKLQKELKSVVYENEKIQQEYSTYVKENENLFNKYEDILEDLKECKRTIDINNNGSSASIKINI